MPNYTTILVEPKGEIEILTLNRPNALNALSGEMVRELDHYLAELHHRMEVRVVLVRGAGRSFCAGLDVKEAQSSENTVLNTWKTQISIGNIMRKMRSAPQPFIALGHGAACGGGFSIMLAADVRFGAPSLRMNAAYIKIGLGGCDIGSSYFLPRLVGASLASEMILTGRFVSAERALRLGLLSDVVAEEKLLEAGLALAREMLETSPNGLRMSKQALNINIDAPSFEAALALEDRQQVMLTATKDYEEAITAFVEKRAPVYTGT